MTGNIKISDLTAATSVNNAAVLPFAYSGTTYKITYTDFKTDLLAGLDFVESTGVATVDNQLMVASGTSGDVIKPSTLTGILKSTSGVVSAATAGTDYAAVGSNSDITALNALTNIGGGAIAGFRNAIINGNFNIWQRGTSFSSPASSSYTADRWWVNYDGTGAFIVSKAGFGRLDSDSLNGFQFQWNQTGAIGGGCTYRQIRQKIENVSSFAGKTVNLSFKLWAATGTGNFSVTYSQNFGTGGSPSTAVTGTILASTPLSSSAYTQYSASITIPSIVGKTLGTNNDDSLEIVFQLPITGAYDVRLMDVQLEAGSVRSEFEQRPIATELAMCQRYFNKSFSIATTPTTAVGTGQNGNCYTGQITLAGAVVNRLCSQFFPVVMRATPTITLYNPINANSQAYDTTAAADCSSTSASSVGERGFFVNATGAAGSAVGNRILLHYTASAEL